MKSEEERLVLLSNCELPGLCKDKFTEVGTKSHAQR